MVALMVEHLPRWMTSTILRDLCARYGQVLSAHVITYRSRTSGWIEMASEEDADSLISGLHGFDLRGCSLTVTRTTTRVIGPAPHT